MDMATLATTMDITLGSTVAMAMEILATTLDVALAPVLLLFNIHHLEMEMETLAITQAME